MQHKGGLKSQKKLVSKNRIYYCGKCGEEKLKTHIETVHRDEDFSVTSVISQQHKSVNSGVRKKISQGYNLLL